MKIENFVIDPETHEVNMIDFGSMSQFPNIHDLKENLKAAVSQPPESLKGGYQLGSECWSIGVITYQLLTGVGPYRGNNIRELFNNIVNGVSRYAESFDYSDQAYDFITNMLGAQVIYIRFLS